MLQESDVMVFANLFKDAKILDETLNFGSLHMNIQSERKEGFINFSGKDFFKQRFRYKAYINNEEIKFYIQLYLNVTSSGKKQYRIASYNKIGNKNGMLFSLNLSQMKDLNDKIFLISRYKFTQKFSENKKLSKAYRKMKQDFFSGILSNLNFDITEYNEVLLGVYDMKTNKFLNTSPSLFIHDFLLISILKGHLMGNKGYRLELLPVFDHGNNIENIQYHSDENDLPIGLKNRKNRRNIPLGLRFKILHRDNYKCVLCGRTVQDGIKLHIDHIEPFSLGGLTILGNLRTLCDECNIGRSNNYNK